MLELHFAQISDIHISTDTELWAHHGNSAAFVSELFAALNHLDFVLITGDSINRGHQHELDIFTRTLAQLQVPYYVIPGNHDRKSPGTEQGVTRKQFASIFNPQYELRPNPPAQAGYWSLEVKPGVQIIGLDSVKEEDWGGVIDAVQLDWLERELIKHADKLVIVTVHHPLHPLAPIDDEPRWTNFVCDNGFQVIELLDHHPQVDLVLTGHHHFTCADMFGQRLHLASPSPLHYPCAYRTIHVTEAKPGYRELSWETHHIATPEQMAQAYQYLYHKWLDHGIPPDVVTYHFEIALGTRFDQQGSMAI